MLSMLLQELVIVLTLATRNLFLHKLRSFLTMLGLVFGVASVIVMLAIAEGAGAEAQRQIEQLGATNVIIRSKKPSEDTREDDDSNQILIYGLTYADLDRINETIPTVARATPLREFMQPMRYLDRHLDAVVVGATPGYADMNHLEMLQGHFLTPVDMDNFHNVAVIGSEIADRLFPYQDAVGKPIRIGHRHYYRIVGVTRYKAPSAGVGSSLSGVDYNKHTYIPISTNRVRFGEMISFQQEGSFSWEELELSQITVEVDELANVKKTAAALEDVLAHFHPRGDYAITVPLELLEKAEATKRIFNLVLGSIASISLLVGGIGIMNIMLANVSERTREIGVHRALGARRRDITVQFLVETAVLSCAGATLGVFFGLAIPPVVSQLSGTTAIIKPWAPAVAFVVAVLVGVGFGVYPARRAAMMDPIEALRAE